MELKFYLNKLLKIDNIEYYSLDALIKLKGCHEKMLEKSEGVDPDFPMMSYGAKGTKIKGTNIASLPNESEL